MCQVWLILAQWFWRCNKMVKVNYHHRPQQQWTKFDQKSFGELKMFNPEEVDSSKKLINSLRYINTCLSWKIKVSTKTARYTVIPVAMSRGSILFLCRENPSSWRYVRKSFWEHTEIHYVNVPISFPLLLLSTQLSTN